MVFDVYHDHSLRVLTREKCGVGTQTHVDGRAKIPTNYVIIMIMVYQPVTANVW